MKIAIIGFGAAAIGFIESIKDSEHRIHVFEKSPDIYSSSISGIRADGKLFVSSEMGGNINIPLNLQKKLVDYYIEKSGNGDVETGKSFKSKAYFEKFYQYGFMPIRSDFYHLGTDQLKQVLFNIYKDFESRKNIKFHFNSTVENVTAHNGKVIVNDKEEFDFVLVSVGRSGHKLITNITKEHPELILNNKKLDLGIRYEVPDHLVAELNKEMYEFKVKYKSKTGYMVRTFCNNPSGYVVTEHYGDFVTVNGHAKIKEKSTNTNFAVLTTVELTQPFNDPTGFGSYIAKLSNLLAGEEKVILQTYAKFKESKRTKHIYRVNPTLDQMHYILGDVNLAYPRRIIESIIDFIENLDKVIPGIAGDDNLVYAPEIKFYSNVLDNLKFKHLKFAGDCSGLTRSIIYATAHGYMIGENL
jgi:uncharacterized FAD-dependent dehydrogenase